MSTPDLVTYERWWVVQHSENSYSGPMKCKEEHATVAAALKDAGRRLDRKCPPRFVQISRSDREAKCDDPCN